MNSANDCWQIVIVWLCSPINLYNQKSLLFATFLYYARNIILSTKYFILGEKNIEKLPFVIVDWLLFSGSVFP